MQNLYRGLPPPQMQGKHHLRLPALPGQHLLGRGVEHLFERHPPELVGIESQKRQGRLVGPHDVVRFIERNDPFCDGADAFGQRMEMQPHMAAVTRLEQAVLDHLGCRPHHAEGMWMAVAALAGNVEHPQNAAIRPGDRRRRAGEKAVALQKMLGPMDRDGHSLGQRGADGIGAAVGLMPGCARHQRHALGTVEKPGIAQGMQQESGLVCQDDHAAAVTHLAVQIFHDRPCMRQELVLALGGLGQLEAAHGQSTLGVQPRVQARCSAAVP